MEQGGQYFCEYDNTTIPCMVHRYIFVAKVVDETGECTVQVFNEQVNTQGQGKAGVRLWCRPTACKAKHSALERAAFTALAPGASRGAGRAAAGHDGR